MRAINWMIFLAMTLICQACLATPVAADEIEIGIANTQEMTVPDRWRLNAAGQLEFMLDPLGNGWVRKNYTVLLVDREPKMCRTRDLRYNWFFTELLLIGSGPVSPPAPIVVRGDRP